MAVIMVVGVLGMTLTSTVQRNVRAYKLGKISHQTLLHNNLVDVFGVLVTMALAILAGGYVSRYVSQLAGKAAEASSRGSGYTAGMLAGIFAGMLVGIGIGYLVRWIWRMFTKPKRAFPSTNRS